MCGVCGCVCGFGVLRMEYRDVGVGGAKAMLDWLLHHRHQQTFFNDQDMQNCRCSQSRREFASNNRSLSLRTDSSITQNKFLPFQMASMWLYWVCLDRALAFSKETTSNSQSIYVLYIVPAAL